MWLSGPGRFTLQNLVELRFTDANFSTRSLKSLLAAVGPRLSKVSIRRSKPRIDASRPGDTLEFDDAVAALQPWARTLKELSFLVDEFESLEFQLPRHRLLGARLLRNFRSLKVLRVDASFLDFWGISMDPFDGGSGDTGGEAEDKDVSLVGEDALTSTLPSGGAHWE